LASIRRHSSWLGVVARFGGAHENIIRDIQSIAHINEMLRHFRCQFSRGDAQVARLLGHLQAVLVGPGLEPHVAAHLALEAGDDIGGNRFIGVADMRLAVGIADRGGHVIGFGHGWRGTVFL
jgi:hypothetical protein